METSVEPIETKKAAPPAPAIEEAALEVKTILVPLDFSKAWLGVLKYAICFASHFKATLHLIHVQPPDDLAEPSVAGNLMLDRTDIVRLMGKELDDLQRAQDSQFWPSNCHVVSGRPFEEICKFARKLEADLIILPTRGHSGLKHLALGSTAERVVRFAPCPVLVPRGAKLLAAGTTPLNSAKLRQILVPTDFSECARAGITYAARLARNTGAALHFYHVVFPYAEVIALDRMAAELPPLIETAKASAEEELKRLKGEEFLAGIPCLTEVRAGQTVEEICRASGRPEVDMVIISSHGRAGFQRALLGSVAEQVVRHADCPVLIVPSRWRSR